MSSPSRGKSKPTARSLARLLNATREVAWILDSDRRIEWVSDTCAAWLAVHAEDLIGRIAAASIVSDDPIDLIAANLAPPFGLQQDSFSVAMCEPPNGSPRSIRYLQIGKDLSAIIIATHGEPIADKNNAESFDLGRLQARIHQWRKRDSAWGGIVAAGSSKAAKRLRAQIQLASSTRQDLSIIGPAGCGSEVIARRIQAVTKLGPQEPLAIAEPLILIDGSLMDAELLEASLSPAAAHLGGDSESDDLRQVTLVIRNLDETPLDVQQRIEQFVSERSNAVRLIGLLSKCVEDCLSGGILIAALASRLDVLSLRIEPLSSRAEDVPLIASAIVDSRHAAGQGTAERLNRASLDRLLLYPWPRNFDELDAAMRQAISVCHSSAIGLEHLPLAIRSYQPGPPKPIEEMVVGDLDGAMQRYELKMIQAAVQAAGGNRSEAARKLNISRARLIRRLGDTESNEPAERE